MREPFTFVINTEQYAGNFEREMCAYVTGQIGECGVGQEEKKQYKTETHKQPLSFIEFFCTNSSCMRPVTICPTPEWFNHGEGREFKEGQEAKALIDYRKQVRAYFGPLIKQAQNSDWKLTDKNEKLNAMKKELATL
jgi:hypothetical protein